MPLPDRVSTTTLANAMVAIAISQWHLPPKLPLWQRMAFATMAETYNSHCVQTACSFSSRHSGNCHSGMCHIFPRWHNLPVYLLDWIGVCVNLIFKNADVSQNPKAIIFQKSVPTSTDHKHTPSRIIETGNFRFRKKSHISVEMGPMYLAMLAVHTGCPRMISIQNCNV